MNDALLVIRLPKQLRQDFKIACAKRGVKMKAVVIAAVEREILQMKKRDAKIREEIENDAR